MIIALILLSIGFAFFGSFSFWSRSIFFAHTFAHIIVLPLTCFHILKLSGLGTMVFMLFFSALFVLLYNNQNKISANNSLLMNISFACNAIALYLSSKYNVDMHEIIHLSGDISKINNFDLASLTLISIAVVLLWNLYGKSIILYFINPSIANTQHKHVSKVIAVINFLFCMFLFSSIRTCGYLLISGMSIIPAIIINSWFNCSIKSFRYSLILILSINFISYLLSEHFNADLAPLSAIAYSVLIGCSWLFKKIILLNK